MDTYRPIRLGMCNAFDVKCRHSGLKYESAVTGINRPISRSDSRTHVQETNFSPSRGAVLLAEKPFRMKNSCAAAERASSELDLFTQ
jgi:hypothetical protein